MQIAYGPPGHRGVSRLLAVGDTEYDSPTDHAVRTGTAIAGAAWLASLAIGSRSLRNLSAGATLALIAVRLAGKRKQVVAAAAPAAASGW